MANLGALRGQLVVARRPLGIARPDRWRIRWRGRLRRSFGVDDVGNSLRDPLRPADDVWISTRSSTESRSSGVSSRIAFIPCLSAWRASPPSQSDQLAWSGPPGPRSAHSLVPAMADRAWERPCGVVGDRRIRVALPMSEGYVTPTSVCFGKEHIRGSISMSHDRRGPATASEGGLETMTPRL